MVPADASVMDPVTWSQFGLAGVVIAAMFWLLMHILNMHKDERKEWHDNVARLNEEMIGCKRETNVVLRELMRVMDEANRRVRRDD